MNSSAVKQHASGVLQAFAAWTGWFLTLDWASANQFAAFVVSVLVVLNMLGVLNPLKARIASLWAARPKAIPGRQPQDE